ncbi:hypothetical protein AAV99_06660 [Aurantiacibacter marinus]|uniref:Short chain dehydrogenase-like proteobacteria domain-containing protein n=1 Tax=Aurantiacibacter marinus TaxID=874156 RepID=A0A0H0XN58_9SPHN|nr:hypothetical protein AAV99_06660 [Aurantiacibacter marinus]
MVRAADLPGSPLDAAAQFHKELLPLIRSAIAETGDAIIAFDHAGHSHDSWRLAVTQELAREAAPVRVNAVIGDLGEAMDSTIAFIASAPGVTGQVFTLA